MYKARIRQFEGEKALHQKRYSLLANCRLALFILAAAGIALGLWRPGFADQLWLVLGLAALACFMAAVVIHGGVSRKLKRAAELRAINGEALNRVERDWNNLAEAPEPISFDGFPLATDLDLLGKASLYHLISTANTPAGRTALARWLLEPAEPEEIKARQGAVAELGPQLEFRQELNFLGRLLAKASPDTGPFLKWAEGPVWLLARRWLVWLPRILCLMTLALLILHIAAILPYPFWLVTAIFNIVLSAILLPRMTAIFNEITVGEHRFIAYAELLYFLSDASFSSAKLKALKQALTTEGVSAHRQMRRLDKIMSLANVRYSGMLHFPVQAITLWDFHILYLFERWQQTVGRHVRGWLEALGELEALCALAGLHHDHPEWCFPIVQNSSNPVISARAMGHPLLHPGQCVVNDLEIGPAGTFLLVTGSNMSGKSTLLRAIGVNTVLAQAGATVHAEAMSLPPVDMGTSFRIRDSLEDGVSYFMAELKRIKEVIDLAAQSRSRSRQGRAFLYLFDEILLGTNVVERQIAVHRVLAHLNSLGAIGAIATHDLTLADAEGLAEVCRPVHFTESFQKGEHGPSMTFDYIMRPGVAPTTNALKLLEIVGLTENRIGSNR